MTTSNQKNIPALRFKEFDGEWEVKRLGEICEKKSSNVTASSIVDNYGEYLLYGASGVLKKVDFYTEEKPYISIVKDGGVGRCMLCKEKSSVLSTMDIIKGRENNNLYFIYLILQQFHFEKFITGSVIPHIYFRDYSLTKLKIPSFKEQQKIASFLTAIDQKVNQLSQKVQLQERYKKGVMQKLFSQELRFKDADGKDFADWEEKRITEIAKTSIGLVTSMTKHYVDNGIPLIRNSDIKQNRIRKSKLINLEIGFAKENEHKKLRINDIVTVHTGDIGVSAIIDEEMDGCLGFATLNTRIIKKELVIPEYLCWYYNSINNIRYAVSMATGDGRSNYNLKDFNKAKIPLPHIQEQQKIVNFLSQLDKQIQQTRQQLAHLQDYKNGLLQQLFV